MQAKLKEVINDAAERNALLMVDWANLPLPQQMLSIERAEANKHIPMITPLRDAFAEVRVEETVAAPTNSVTSKKRKSSELAHEEIAPSNTAQNLPWRQVKSENVFEDRITYPVQVVSKLGGVRQPR